MQSSITFNSFFVPSLLPLQPRMPIDFGTACHSSYGPQSCTSAFEYKWFRHSICANQQCAHWNFHASAKLRMAPHWGQRRRYGFFQTMFKTMCEWHWYTRYITHSRSHSERKIKVVEATPFAIQRISISIWITPSQQHIILAHKVQFWMERGWVMEHVLMANSRLPISAKQTRKKCVCKMLFVSFHFDTQATKSHIHPFECVI